MVPHPWAGNPVLRVTKRLLGYRAPRPWEATRTLQPILFRRLLLLALVVAGAVVGTANMLDVVPGHGSTWTEKGFLALFGILFAWISAGFWTALMGAWVLLRRHDPDALTNALRGIDPAQPIPAAVRTAVIMPIYNEDVPTVFGGLRATIESVAQAGALETFDFHVLSDTSDPDIRAAEQAAFSALVEQLNGDHDEVKGAAKVRVYYRWRTHRKKAKAGNVDDFCRRFGRSYRYMVVLDADSVMTGECLATLVKLMEAHPDAGIIQTAPRGVGHSTLHARIQQFTARAYGPLFTAGMHFWQLGESHYWGHNAIVRMAPFIAHCGLAKIPGRSSLAGHVMSHDFVEAALMRRAGWKVWIAHDLDGSYEQVPPNLLAELQRERRWCHGNLQNSRLMTEPGLHPVHRTVFLTGVLAYLSAPLWFAFLVLSAVLFATHARELPQYFLHPYQLFPTWPSVNVELILTLFATTAVLLFAPKVLSLVLIVAKGQARQFGGVLRLLASAVIEFLHSLLLAPVRMLFHTQFVFTALTGWKFVWKSPPRDDAVTSLGEAIRRHGLHTLLAVVCVVAIVKVSAAFPWWLSPVIVGLLAAIPLSAWSSRSGPGRWLRARGVLLIPEEVEQPAVLAEAERHEAEFRAMPGFVEAVTEGVAHDRVTRAISRRTAAAGLKGQAQARLVEQAVTAGPRGLDFSQRLRLLADAEALRLTRERVLRREAHPDWWKSPQAVAAARRHAPSAGWRPEAGVPVPVSQ
jgi:membrane glycosyltransferase